MDPEKEYEFVGNFDLHSAEELCARLETEHIDFELEIDDSPIRNLMPFEAALGGTYGAGASANIYVRAEDLDRCQALLREAGLLVDPKAGSET